MLGVPPRGSLELPPWPGLNLSCWEGKLFVWAFSNFIGGGWKPERKPPTFLPRRLHHLFPNREGIVDLSGQNPRPSLGPVLVRGTAGPGRHSSASSFSFIPRTFVCQVSFSQPVWIWLPWPGLGCKDRLSHTFCLSLGFPRNIRNKDLSRINFFQW